ncbi:MAG: GNAT family N-acetyltransferase [Deltaproteobacteria bacterium]
MNFLQALLGLLDGRAIGFCSLTPSRDVGAEPGTAEVSAIYVDPDHYRSGAGTALMQAALAVTRCTSCATASRSGAPAAREAALEHRLPRRDNAAAGARIVDAVLATRHEGVFADALRQPGGLRRGRPAAARARLSELSAGYHASSLPAGRRCRPKPPTRARSSRRRSRPSPWR